MLTSRTTTTTTTIKKSPSFRILHHHRWRLAILTIVTTTIAIFTSTVTSLVLPHKNVPSSRNRNHIPNTHLKNTNGRKRISPNVTRYQHPHLFSSSSSSSSNPNNNPSDSSSSSSSPISPSSYYIPPQTLTEIKSQTNILDVIQSYNLPSFTISPNDPNRATALCPFHDDTNPSLSIDATKGIYKCWSCGAGGDVFAFVREMDWLLIGQNKGRRPTTGRMDGGDRKKKMGFGTAVRKVVEEYCSGSGIVLPSSSSSSSFRNNNDNPTGVGGEEGTTTNTQAKQKAIANRKLRQRIYLANAAAADYYARLLVTLPSAGIARSHLRLRGVTPVLTRSFALGFAPDVYFGESSQNRAGGSSSSGKNKWGEGSCVERLGEMGFTPMEILEAGLATVTKGGRERLERSKKRENGGVSKEELRREVLVLTNSTVVGGGDNDQDGNVEEKNSTPTITTSDPNNNNGDEKVYELQLSDLMDRFRNRLIVPIFDESGSHILGFGGRHLEPSSSASSPPPPSKKKKKTNDTTSTRKPFVAAKYMNTPITPVFIKRETLFGLHGAASYLSSETPSFPANEEEEATSSNPPILRTTVPTVLIVEGYFDAIALVGAGIAEATACMGSAVSGVQLEKAAGVVGSGGTIILCLDADKAGVAAMERFCSTPNLPSTLSGLDVNLHIATIPPPYKDPAEFLAKRSGDDFRKEVMEPSKVWGDWYVEHIVRRRYGSEEEETTSKTEKEKHDGDGGGRASRETCDDLADFISRFTDPLDRTRRAYSAAKLLAEQIAGERDHGENDDDGDGMEQRRESIAGLRLRLEADLADAVSRRARSKESLGRRIEEVGFNTVGVGGVERRKESLVERLSRGEGSGGTAGNGGGTSSSYTSGAIKTMEGSGINGSTYDDLKKKNRVITAEQFYRRKLGDGRKGWTKSTDKNKNVGMRRYPPSGGRIWKRSSSSPVRPPVTEHFAGFSFFPTDAAWFGLSGEDSNDGDFILGDVYTIPDATEDTTTLTQSRRRRHNKKTKPVYFNSDRYLGDETPSNLSLPTTTTAAAALTGYDDETNNPPLTAKRLLRPDDTDRIVLDAEERLLRTMVVFGSARTAMEAALEQQKLQRDEEEEMEEGGGVLAMDWSSKEREWLFQCLTGGDAAKGQEGLTRELQEGGTIDQLRNYLASRPDAPIGAFAQTKVDRGSSSSPSPFTSTTSMSHFGRSPGNDPDIVVDVGIANDTEEEKEEGKTDAEPLNSVQSDPGSNEYEGTVFMEEDAATTATTTTITSPSSEIGSISSSLSSSFSSIPDDNNRNGYGSLETFFRSLDGGDDDDNNDKDPFGFQIRDGSVSHEIRAELTVQQTVAIVLRATAIKRLHALKERWEVVAGEVAATAETADDDDDNDETNSADVRTTKAELHNLGRRVTVAADTVRRLTESCTNLTTRLMEYCGNAGVEGRVSERQREELRKKMERHIADLPPDPPPGTSGGYEDGYVFGSEAFERDVGGRWKGGMGVGVDGEGVTEGDGEEEEEEGLNGREDILDQDFA